MVSLLAAALLGPACAPPAGEAGDTLASGDVNPDGFYWSQILGIHTDVVGFISELPRIFAGQPMRRDKVIDSLAQHVVMESDEEIGYTVDGDTYVAKGRLEMRLGPPVTLIRLSGDARGEAPIPTDPPGDPPSSPAPEIGSASPTVIS